MYVIPYFRSIIDIDSSERHAVPVGSTFSWRNNTIGISAIQTAALRDPY